MKPNYYVIGFPKSGTTTLCEMLGQHPDVFMAPEKEVSFFCDDLEWGRGFDWYESIFDRAGEALRRGEGSQRYTMSYRWPEVPQRIAEYTPDAKLIVIARNPMDRIPSMWLQLHGGPRKPAGTLAKAVAEEPGLFIDAMNGWHEINRYRERFADDQILVVFFEDFRLDPEPVLRQCLDFLEVPNDTSGIELAAHLNPGEEHRRAMTPLAVARRSSLFRGAIRLVPDRLRRPLRDRLLIPPPPRPAWDAETRKFVVNALREDTERFLEFCGKPRDFWPLVPPKGP